MAFETLAFPTIDLTRMMGHHGLTAQEVFNLAALTGLLIIAALAIAIAWLIGADESTDVAAQRAAIHRKYREVRS
ncbi:hypothetical protein [Cereibacter johrii]|uniref:hypothetical protein n=1 Tax=Cereibacter johrii TaxID=445629 RepID=UPI003CF963C7